MRLPKVECRRSFSLLAVLLVGVLQACSSSSSSSEPVAQPSGSLLSSTTVAIPTELPAASSATQFDYSMDAVTGGTTTARAMLFLPSGDMPDDGYALVVWAHGTTGISNACAPSLSFDNLGDTIPINSLLETGYAVLAPDYEGFGTPTIHPYYLRSSHANSVLAAIPAAHNIEDSQLSDDWALLGYSQGGHVALSTARAEQHAAYPLQAVVALAPGSDLEPLSQRAFEAVDLALAEGNFNEAAERVFYLTANGTYVAQAMKLAEPSFDPKSFFGDPVADLMDIALDSTVCGDYLRVLNEAFADHIDGGGTPDTFGGLKRDWYTEPTIAGLLVEQELGDEAQAAPLLIVQGDADRQIPVAATTAFVDRQSSLGTDVTYEVVAGARHGDVVRGEFGRALNWLAQRFAPQ